MSSEEPNGYELQRNIDAIRKDFRDGLFDIKLIVAGLVSRDLFDAEKNRRDEQINELRRDLESAQNNHWRAWTQVILPIACLAGTVIINVYR